ncbi:MAG: alpha-amylase family glycosyl hydrolase [Candidatus Limnocylindrales bacterium]
MSDVGAPAPPPIADPVFGNDWWQRGVTYQVYPRSLQDTDGDGIGDLRGIIDRLAHLQRLGVDAVWLSPIYPSPGLDIGYDVADHSAVDPLYGSMADFDDLVATAHGLGLRVVLDLVMNHTSDQHRWFQDSRRSRTGEHADWYIWRDAAGTDRRGRPRPPNNWQSFFGGPAWTWEPAREQFYMHTFLAQQPELDWRSAEVRDAQMAMIRGWLERGVDGFRLDVFNAFFKHAELPDNPAIRDPRRWQGRGAYFRQDHLYDKEQPELHGWLREFRAVVDEQPGRMTVGEQFSGTGVPGALPFVEPRHLVFDFRTIETAWSAPAWAESQRVQDEGYVGDKWPTLVLSNHDRSRQVTRLRDGKGLGGLDQDALAKAAAVLLLASRGTPFLYYGEEIGLGDSVIPRRDIVDPPARQSLIQRLWAPWWNRDQCRGPMPWTGGTGRGFTTGHPWLPFSPDSGTRNVAAQEGDPHSVLATYRALLALRRASPALQLGTSSQVSAGPDVYAWRREHEGQVLLCAVNFADRDASFALTAAGDARSWAVRYDSADPAMSAPAATATLQLRPLEAIILEAVPDRT